jgi:acetolactate synthase-1/2/3 large subunit
LEAAGMSIDHPQDLFTGGDRLAEALAGLGVEVAFGLPGVHNLSLWPTFAARGIRIVGVRHEQSCAYAADGYARATGKLGVALVTTGPGAANAVCATGEAYTVGSPVLVIATDIETTVRVPGVFRGALHECRDQTGMFVPVTKQAFYSEHPDRLGADTLRAASAALAAPSGPVYLGVPLDVLNGPAPTAATAAEPAAPPAAATAEELRGAAAVINEARRPLLWAGGGAVASDCGGLLRELAERTGAVVMTTYKAKGIVSFDHPQVLVSPPQVPACERLWDEADLVIAVGTDFDAMMTRSWRFRQPRRLLAINVDRADAAKNYRPDRVLQGDAAHVLAALLPYVAEAGRRGETAARVAAVDAAVWDEAAAECQEATCFLDAITETLPHDANIVADMCVAGYWLGGFARMPAPRKLAYPVGWGTLGFALPAAIGVAAAGTGPTVVVTGDGGFLYAPGELATIVQERLPVTIVVVDDGGYGMLKFAQDIAGAPNLGVALHTPDFAGLAASFGLGTRHVTGLGAEFAGALAEAVASGRPNLIWAEAALLPPPNTSTRSVTARA